MSNRPCLVCCGDTSTMLLVTLWKLTYNQISTEREQELCYTYQIYGQAKLQPSDCLEICS